ncbi:MAG TPA: HlyD family efflux transporter periplasmic adaptor subunit [Roseibacterium sp.]|nr:HlyD family efflux transporter periplasmic adaptor subunit [Roseibacterium sp.]
MPWVQTIVGRGQVTALDPTQRNQTIMALNSGRIGHWHVSEGGTVKSGDPIVEIVDLDPQLVERLKAERTAIENRYQAARSATQTANIDLQRQRRLFDQGLASRNAFENAQIKYQELLSRQSAAEADLRRTQISLSRQSTLIVTAPSDGIIVQIIAGDTATLVTTGTPLAQFVPTHAELAAELYVSSLDASLVTPGRKVRLQFEGWPAVQSGGWPEVAIGTFGGIVTIVDPVISPNGRFRIVVSEDPDDLPWPDRRYLRFGAKAQGWVLLDQVSVAYELWRRLNGFPPENTDVGNVFAGRGGL